MKMKWNRYICLACISFALVGCGSKKVLWETFDKSKTPAQWAQYVQDKVYEL